MSSWQLVLNKLRAVKYHHFCFGFDHNYCPTCREAGKGDDLCVTGQSLCSVFHFFSEEQINKIKNRRYHYKEKANTSHDESELLLGDPEAWEPIFAGSQQELESFVNAFYQSPPQPSSIVHSSPQQLAFEALSIKSPQLVLEWCGKE